MQLHRPAKPEQSGFSAVEVLLVALVTAVLAATSLVIYQRLKSTRAASGVAEKTGQTVTQPMPATTQYFTIKEWDIRAPYSGPLQLTYNIDASNKIAWINSQQLAAADPKNCPTVSGGGNLGGIFRYLPTDSMSDDGSGGQTAQEFFGQNFAASNSAAPAYAKIGIYYYTYSPGRVSCSPSDSVVSEENQERSALDIIVKDLQAVPN